ncbi:endo-1,3-beta glucanase [Lecanora helva]
MSAQSPLTTHVEDLHRRGGIDCFQPVATQSLPHQIPSKGGHPVPRLGISPQSNPVSTNRFYANLFIGTQGQGAWTHPYSVAWSKGSGNAKSWGFAVSHIDADQRADGPRNAALSGSPVQYFINPIGIQSIILSAVELNTSTTLTTSSLEAFSVNVTLSAQAGSRSNITIPLVQGSGFITGIYCNLMPAIQSSVFFRTVTQIKSVRGGIYKYRIILEDGKTWLLYAIPKDGRDPQLKLVSNTQLQGLRGWSGKIQVAKNPAGSTGEAVYDSSAGVFPVTAAVTGSVSATTGAYRLQWGKAGLTNLPLLMYALPHHVQSFDGMTSRGRTSIQLQTTTKGLATAVVGDSWTFVEPDLPIGMGFAPWTPTSRGVTHLSKAAATLIQQVAVSEIGQDYDSQTNLDSMYFSGKALAKFATLVFTVHDLLNQPSIASSGLSKLKVAFARFATNRQINPLLYDTVWNGIVSSGSYKSGDPGQDFGNAYYNDHHFHYGYFIYTAAVIGYLDPTWLGPNRDWVNALVRDVANPSLKDNAFPFSRMFDWYHGHSFAKGLFESADSKDEESSSEDAFCSYAIKMWGQVIKDASMEARGNLMLAIQARTFSNYFLMQKSNVNQPANFIGNKVTGILFENKIDHTTYFGANPEYIQGIHMLPLSPAAAYTRPFNFIREEWDTYFNHSSPYPASNISGGWKGILYGNLACIDPRTSWQFFSQQNFDGSWIDGGASRTWYLAFAAALGGA